LRDGRNSATFTLHGGRRCFIVNTKKTKEMIICPSNSNVFSPLSIADVEIERVDVFKLLGVYINRSLKWDEHVRSICKKAALRIHF